MNTITRVAAVIPAHNEHLVIEKTLLAITNQSMPVDVYVVDDCSGDGTGLIALHYTDNVLFLEKNRGKAGAINAALAHFDLPRRYDFVFLMDADTQPSATFAEQCVQNFLLPENRDIACVVGRVQGMGGSWVGKYRLWEYHIAHSIYKSVQASLQAVLVVPGCATMYRGAVLQKMQIPEGTLTEDMDFTFLLHRNGFSRMVFEPKAVVYTQDPQTIRDFIKQMDRWYTGFWQTIRKYNAPWMGQNLDFEVALLASEGLFGGIVMAIVLLMFPILSYHHSQSILLVPIGFDLLAFFIPTIIWVCVQTRTYTLPLYIPLFYLIRILTSLLFLKSFFRAYLSRAKAYTWNTKRFSLTDTRP